MSSALDDAPKAAISSTLQQLDPEHLKLIGLRVQGHSWTKCAAHLGVDRTTVLRWRWEHPAIDQAVMEESLDFLAASKHRMAALMERADDEVAAALDATKTIAVGETPITINDTLARLAAVKLVREPFAKATGDKPRVSVTVNAHERALPSAGSARMVDAEPDDFSDLIGPDKHAAR